MNLDQMRTTLVVAATSGFEINNPPGSAVSKDWEEACSWAVVALTAAAAAAAAAAAVETISLFQ